MNHIARTASALVILAASVWVTSPALAAPAPTDAAWEKFTSARRVFQIRLCDLATRRWPAHKAFFAAHRDLQLAYLQRRNLVFYHFVSSQPSRIVRDQGGQAFLGFGWTREEDAEFRKTIPAYAELSEEIARLQAISDKFKDRDVLRDRYARLEIDPEYLALMREMTRSITEGERMLAASAATALPAPAAPAPAA